MFQKTGYRIRIQANGARNGLQIDTLSCLGDLLPDKRSSP